MTRTIWICLLATLLTLPLAAQTDEPPRKEGDDPQPMISTVMEDEKDTEDAETSTGRAAILDMLERERQAYLADDGEALLELYADEIVVVSRGQVNVISKQQLEDTLVITLNQYDYKDVETLGNPVVRFSPDGRMAWVAVRQRVRRAQQVDEGQEKEGEFVFAGSYTYEKRDDGWVRTSSSSTFGQ